MNLIPNNARFFLESLFGKTDTITERDFSEQDLRLLKETAIKKSKEGKSQATMLDYGGFPDNASWYDAVVKSYTDPKFRIGTSLGDFGVRSLPNHYEIYDEYSWNGDFAKPQQTLQDLWNQPLNRPTQFLNSLAEIFAPKTKRPVKIKIDK